MIQIPITNVPNQTLSVQLDGNNYDISLHSTADISGVPESGLVAVTLVRNNTLIVSGLRAVSGFPIIPSAYLEDGNFMIVTQNDAYPNWQEFGITQFLVYASETELEAIRDGSATT